MSTQIFISYSSRDRDLAKDLVGRLNADGFACWMDQSGISAATQWSSEIVQAIESCSVFIILLSQNALTSDNVIKELSLASEGKKNILPVELESVKLSNEVKYHLAGLQRVSHNDYPRIEEAVRRFLGTQEISSHTPAEVRRHLLAVMFSDIQGYSLMMNADEQRAMKILNYHNSFMRQMIESHEGRVIEIIGDAFLAVFESAVRAVEACIAIQQGFKERNDASDESDRFHVRIGVHLGDIIEEHGGVKGDAVNIAARIQAIASGGGIAISENIYNAVRHKTPLEVVSLGSKKLKNIREPYTLYSIKGLGEIQTAVAEAGAPVDDTAILSLAVLPFDDLSQNGDNGWFADGMMDELISTLGSRKKLRVPSRTDVMYYKKNRPKAREIAQDLNVRYLVEGSVRKAGDKIRITASLTDTATNRQLWTNNYNGTFADVFDVQVETAKAITEALKLKLTPEEAKPRKQKCESCDAYELYLKSLEHYRRQTKTDFELALTLLESAVKIDPNYADAYGNISNIAQDIYRLYSRSPVWLEKAEAAAQKVFDIEGETAQYFGAISKVALSKGDKESALRYAKRCVELAPRYAHGYDALAFANKSLGDLAGAVDAWEKYVGLQENRLVGYLNLLLDLHELGDEQRLFSAAEKAIPIYERHIRLNPDDFSAHVDFANVLNWANRKTEAMMMAEALAEMKSLDGFTLYNLACLFLAAGSYDRGMDILRHAVTAGFRNIDVFLHDPDLSPVRGRGDFQKLIEELIAKLSEA